LRRRGIILGSVAPKGASDFEEVRRRLKPTLETTHLSQRRTAAPPKIKGKTEFFRRLLSDALIRNRSLSTICRVAVPSCDGGSLQAGTNVTFLTSRVPIV
jgi:hypothetical protein